MANYARCFMCGEKVNFDIFLDKFLVRFSFLSEVLLFTRWLREKYSRAYFHIATVKNGWLFFGLAVL